MKSYFHDIPAIAYRGPDSDDAPHPGPRPTAARPRYLTADGASSPADERRRNGRARPWTVKYFGVGNETWGSGGHVRAEFAADLHRRYAGFLRAPVLRVAAGDGTATTTSPW